MPNQSFQNGKILGQFFEQLYISWGVMILTIPSQSILNNVKMAQMGWCGNVWMINNWVWQVEAV
jgi:hypothetical protein